MLGRQRLDQRRVAERCGAEDRAAGAGREHRVDVVGLAQAAADLHRDLDRRADPLDLLDVHRRAVAGAVEVDDVQRRGALPTQRRAASLGSASKAVSRS